MPVEKEKSKNKVQAKNKSSILNNTFSFADIFKGMFEEHPSPIIVVDSRDLSIQYVNKSACLFYGYSKKSFLKIKLNDIDITLKNKTAFQALGKYSRDCFLSRHKMKNGDERDVEVYNSRFSEQGRQFLSLVIHKTGEDANLLSEKEKQLEELKLRFLSTSSHEFRTPLTTILTSSEVLLMVGRTLSEARYVDYIIQIQNAVIYMTSLLDDILTINKTEVGKWKFCPSKIDLRDFSAKMIAEIRNIASRSHNFNLQFEMKDKHAIVDIKLLHHILSNLLSNAVKYSPRGGEIMLKVRNTKSEIEFTIADKGIGVAKQDQNKLFETFYRGDNTTGIEGTGLGLSIVKRCVESHGGRINFKSRLNKGSTFIVSIPMMTVL